jgi:hypothetical protein
MNVSLFAKYNIIGNVQKARANPATSSAVNSLVEKMPGRDESSAEVLASQLSEMLTGSQ